MKKSQLKKPSATKISCNHIKNSVDLTDAIYAIGCLEVNGLRNNASETLVMGYLNGNNHYIDNTGQCNKKSVFACQVLYAFKVAGGLKKDSAGFMPIIEFLSNFWQPDRAVKLKPCPSPDLMERVLKELLKAGVLGLSSDTPMILCDAIAALSNGLSSGHAALKFKLVECSAYTSLLEAKRWQRKATQQLCASAEKVTTVALPEELGRLIIDFSMNKSVTLLTRILVNMLGTIKTAQANTAIYWHSMLDTPLMLRLGGNNLILLEQITSRAEAHETAVLSRIDKILADTLKRDTLDMSPKVVFDCFNCMMLQLENFFSYRPFSSSPDDPICIKLLFNFSPSAQGQSISSSDTTTVTHPLKLLFDDLSGYKNALNKLIIAIAIQVLFRDKKVRQLKATEKTHRTFVRPMHAP